MPSKLLSTSNSNARIDPKFEYQLNQLLNSTDLDLSGFDTATSTSPEDATSSPTLSYPSTPVANSGTTTATADVDNKQFHCTECPLSFRRNHDLKRHVKIHLPVRPYTYELCAKSFNRKDALRRHVLSNACKMIKSGQPLPQHRQQQQRWTATRVSTSSPASPIAARSGSSSSGGIQKRPPPQRASSSSRLATTVAAAARFAPATELPTNTVTSSTSVLDTDYFERFFQLDQLNSTADPPGAADPLLTTQLAYDWPTVPF